MEQAIHLLESRFLERGELIRLLLLGIMSGENALLIGPPGTAKSQMARAIAQLFGSEHWFEYLLTRFTTPDEIFGPVSLQQLKQDQYVRKTAGYLPSAQFAFLDEIFKANSAILNALLSILNERLYFNGREKEHVPLHFLIAASNELPDENEQLAALYDRFLIRYEVTYLQHASSYEAMFNLPKEPLPVVFSLYDSKDVQAAASSVELPEGLVYFLYRLKQDMEEKEMVLSDRRLSKIAHVWKTSAALHGRDRVSIWDTIFTPHMLWDVPEDLPVLREMFEARFMEALKEEIDSELPLRRYNRIANRWLEKEAELHAFQFKKEIGAKMGKEAAETYRSMLEECRQELEETARELRGRLLQWLEKEKDLASYIREKNYLIDNVDKYAVKYAHLRMEGERILQVLQGLYRTIFDREIPGCEYDYTL
ncbi:AAA domain-containing protein [Brevibacillus sp. SYP-B805]|uniref:AAA family ATPase n=1 Tax=Brevibacillus sp. SYP-B805 TaxID=1578199 RepID=UPI0013E99E86|nr:AAA family ATPase [Brevibacillus sp. SYP-B805]NGQ95743.1 AAA domain-containing protein [Brevibacillus sp. SYP-B805]